MNIISNDALIRRNKRIAQVAMLGGLVILGAGIYFSFQSPEQVESQFTLMLLALILGFGVTQIGIFFSQRWGRSPRPDELLNQSLKGLDGRYSIYHYKSPTAHLLIGPAGIWVLVPKYQRGIVTYSKNRWRQKSLGFAQMYLRIFGQEGIGRPDLEVSAEMDSMKAFIAKKLPDADLPPVHAALVFTADDVKIDIPEEETPPAETVYLKDLKELVRKAAKAKSLSAEKVSLVQQALENL